MTDAVVAMNAATETLNKSIATYGEQNTLNEESRQVMVAQNLSASSAILSQLTSLFTETSYYVDNTATDGGTGKSGTPFNDVMDALRIIPVNGNIVIYLRAGTGADYIVDNPDIADGQSEIVKLMNSTLRFSNWGDLNVEGKAKLVVKTYLNTDNNLLYSKVRMTCRYLSEVHVRNIDFEYQLPSEGAGDGLAQSGAFILSYIAGSIKLVLANVIVNILPNMHVLSPYDRIGLLSIDAHLSLNTEIIGGGDLVRNTYHAPVRLHVLDTTIAEDTYLFQKMQAGRDYILTAYSGNQLAREVV